MHVIAYTGQSDSTLKLYSEQYDQTLICMDSGSSFRNNISVGYIPSNVELNITRRPPNTSFRKIEDLEAEDIRALYMIKYKIQEPKNTRSIIKKVLSGNPNRGIPQIMNSSLIMDLLPLIDPESKTTQAIMFLCKNYDIDERQIWDNFQLTSRELKVYVENIDHEDFTKIYNSL